MSEPTVEVIVEQTVAVVEAGPVLSVDGQVGAVDLNATYVAQTDGGMPTIPAYKITGAALPNWRKAVATARAGGWGKVLCIGDSTTWGYSAAFLTHADFVTRLRQLLNSYHVPTSEGAINLSSSNGADGAKDPRVTLGTGWQWDATATLGQANKGGAYSNVSAAGELTIAPGYTFDTIVLTYITFSGKGSVTVNIGGASLGTINANSSAGLGQTTLSCTRGTNTIHVTGATGGDFQMLTVEAYDSTAPAIRFTNLGVDGSSSVDWAANANPYESLFMIDKFTPDLTIITLGINDSGNAVGTTTFDTKIRALITKAHTYGDVLLCSMVPSNPSVSGAYSTEPTYVAALKAISDSLGVAYVDLFNRYGGSHTQLDTLGFYEDAGVHPNAKGYADIAGALFAVLRAV